MVIFKVDRNVQRLNYKLILNCTIMYQINRNKDKRAILLGMAIGDGYITNSKNYKALVIRHSKKQESYLLFKKQLLENIFKDRVISARSVQNGIQIAIGNNKIFSIYRKWLYPNGIKYIPNVLKYLDLQSVAIWYMDDGSLTAKKRNGKIHGYELTLNTYVSKEENQLIINWFKEKYSICFTQTKGKGKYRLRMGTKEARKFIFLVQPYIYKTMSYKINL